MKYTQAQAQLAALALDYLISLNSKLTGQSAEKASIISEINKTQVSAALIIKYFFNTILTLR